jgi:hypothetical protein
LTNLRNPGENMRLLRKSGCKFQQNRGRGHLQAQVLVAVEQYYVTI